MTHEGHEPEHTDDHEVDGEVSRRARMIGAVAVRGEIEVVEVGA